MSKKSQVVIISLMTIILATSCTLPFLSLETAANTPKQEPNSIPTYTELPVNDSELDYLPSDTPVTPTDTERPSETIAPSATIKPTPTPFVYAPQDTNCRSGPGLNYFWLGLLKKGETSEIKGRNPQGTWLAVVNLDSSGLCYVSKSVMQVHNVDSIDSLIAFTPPPSPPPPPTLTFTSTLKPTPKPTLTFTPELPTAPNPGDPRLDVDPGSGPAGTIFTFLIRDFKPSEVVTVKIFNSNSDLIDSFTVTMDSKGNKDHNWTSPGDLPVGPYIVRPFDSNNKQGKPGTFVII